MTRMNLDFMISVRLDARTAAQLMKVARAEDRKPSEWVRRLVVRELAAQKEQTK